MVMNNHKQSQSADPQGLELFNVFFGDKKKLAQPILVESDDFPAKRSTGKPRTVFITGQVIT